MGILHALGTAARAVEHAPAQLGHAVRGQMNEQIQYEQHYHLTRDLMTKHGVPYDQAHRIATLMMKQHARMAPHHGGAR